MRRGGRLAYLERAEGLRCQPGALVSAGSNPARPTRHTPIVLLTIF